MSEEELERGSGSDAGQEAEEDDAEEGTSAEQSEEDDDDDGDDDDEDEDEGDGEDDDGGEESDQPAPRRKRFRIEDLPQRDMPNRATRANRYSKGEVVADEEEGDADFWCVGPRAAMRGGGTEGHDEAAGVERAVQAGSPAAISPGTCDPGAPAPTPHRPQEPGLFCRGGRRWRVRHGERARRHHGPRFL